MLTVTIDPDLEHRLRTTARRQGRTPEECALSAVRAFVQDCEEAWEHSCRLGTPQDHVRVEEFWD